jgi:hypothetical protein
MRNLTVRLFSWLLVLCLLSGLVVSCGSSGDVTVSSVTVTPQMAVTGQSATVEADVTNSGTSESKHTVV